MSRRTLRVGIALAGAAVLAVIAWRAARPHGARNSTHVAIVRDRSGSTTSGCAAVVGLAALAMHAEGVTKDSSLFVFATGDGQTAGEPVEIVRLARFKTQRATEGRRAVLKREQALLANLFERCESTGSSNRSPILLAVRRAFEQLRVAGCQPGSGCQALIQSDGAENVEPAVRRALGGSPKPGRLPAPIDNAGIVVVFCGWSETSGPSDRSGRLAVARTLHDSRRAERTAQVWRRLFTQPELVTFEPHCPKAEGPSTPSKGPAVMARR